ncbi:PIR Superfamily Protein [Plasmodium ovale wallikeri]|uniref:PIR Superfamily Protein n=1 Tax=Plasmodium ovale wallikeri TaxID=864142 RepID=A0A1A9AID9_PLAOA|nr:PIR Superfamily Protein [Plasmodium ovale wallikeri]SBT55937.1 PIR Superfamily Protein [Plasmodium ovale wallikeri]
MASKKPNIYSFFETFKDYKSYEGHVDKIFLQNQHNTTCDAFIKDIKISRTESAKSVCKKFKYLYNFLLATKKPKKSEYLDDNDFSFLNYWLNCMLRNNTITYKLTVEDFYGEMSDHEIDFISDTFKEKLYEIEDEDFNNMILLNDLDDNHSEIFQNTISIKENTTCIKYFQKYISKYKQGIIQCPNDDTDFCKALKLFKEKYEQNFLAKYSVSENCIDRELIKLPQYNDVSLGDKKITVIGSILGPSFGTFFTLAFLYKFTPFGQWMRAIMGRKKGVHSNLYKENGELSLNNSDADYINLSEDPYYISYDSVVNT